MTTSYNQKLHVEFLETKRKDRELRTLFEFAEKWTKIRWKYSSSIIFPGCLPLFNKILVAHWLKKPHLKFFSESIAESARNSWINEGEVVPLVSIKHFHHCQYQAKTDLLLCTLKDLSEPWVFPHLLLRIHQWWKALVDTSYLNA